MLLANLTRRMYFLNKKINILIGSSEGQCCQPGIFYAFFWKKGRFFNHGAFSFVNKNAIKHGKNAPFLCIGIFSEVLMLKKNHLGHFFTEEGAFFSFRGVGNTG